MERIGVTHAGSLIRPPELLAFLSAADHGQASTDGAEYQAALGRAVDYVVRRQAETGIDVVDDGEMGKATWITYLYERTTGLEARPLNGAFSTILPASRDRQNFPGAYAELDRLEHDATVRIRDKAVGAAKPAKPATAEKERQGAAVWVCTGPMRYDRAAIDRDLANVTGALARNGRDISAAFLPVVAPASAYWLRNGPGPGCGWTRSTTRCAGCPRTGSGTTSASGRGTGRTRTIPRCATRSTWCSP